MHVLLLDLGLQLNSRQKQLLSLASLIHESQDATVCVACLFKSELASRLRDCNIPALELPGSGNSLFMGPRLKAYLNNSHPDILHAFGGNAIRVLKRNLGHIHGSRLFLSLDAMPLESREKTVPPAWFTSKELLNNISKIICPSAGTMSRLSSRGISKTLLCSIPYGISDEGTRLHTSRADGRFVFLASAPMRRESGLLTLIDALSFLKDRTDVPPWEVRIIGYGKDIELLLQHAREVGVEGYISLLGKQSYEDQLALCDMAIMTNPVSTEHNTFILQAWHARVPLICSAVPSTLELLGNARNALLFVPGNSAALASTMLRSMIDPNLYHRLCIAAQTEFPKHTLRAVSATLIQMYKEAAADSL